MKEFEDKTLEEILLENNPDEIKRYIEFFEDMKSSFFTRQIADELYGEPLSKVYQEVYEEEQKYTSMIIFPGDLVLFYPGIKEQRTKNMLVCDFSGGIIYPGSIYINYRPLIANISSKENFVLSRTLKVELGYQHYLPRTFQDFETLDNKLRIECYEDSSGIDYSHLSQRTGGELTLTKLQRRK